jgi:release factor glutamine methyltransferase
MATLLMLLLLRVAERARSASMPPPVPSVQSDSLDVLAASEVTSAESLLLWRRSLLQRGGHPPDLDWLLDLVGGLGWSELQALRLHPDRPVRLLQGRPYLEQLWQRHLDHGEPLQYLVGRCPWRDLELIVAPGVLIPRQETELLIDLALSLLPSLCADLPSLWADLGTGSGCLAVALARALPTWQGFALDRSPEALAQAAENLGASGADQRVTLLHSDWWGALAPWWGSLRLVVSNPPYIPTAVVAGLDPVVRDHEPRLALDGGADGLDAIRRIVAGANGALAPGGLLVLEHHHDQSGAVLELLRAAGMVDVHAHPDLEGTLRFASAAREVAL